MIFVNFVLGKFFVQIIFQCLQKSRIGPVSFFVLWNTSNYVGHVKKRPYFGNFVNCMCHTGSLWYIIGWVNGSSVWWDSIYSVGAACSLWCECQWHPSSPQCNGVSSDGAEMFFLIQIWAKTKQLFFLLWLWKNLQVLFGFNYSIFFKIKNQSIPYYYS